MSDVKTDPRETMTPAVLDSVEPLPGAPSLAVFRVRPADGSEVPAFEPGQYVRLAFDAGGEVAVRYYSIASAPEQRQHLEFYIVEVPKKGASTQDLFHFQPGHPLWFSEPEGGFTLGRTDREHLALVCTGTGLAPYVSMLRHLAAGGAAGRARPAGVSLWHGVRHSADLGYRTELEALQTAQPFPFAYVPTVSRFDEEQAFDAARHSRGRVEELLLRVLGLPGCGDPRGAVLASGLDAGKLARALPGGGTAIFLCGNPSMIQAFEKAAGDSAWHPHLVYERYW